MMKQNKECNLSIMDDTIVPDWPATGWNTVDPNQLPLFDSTVTDAHINLKFDFSYYYFSNLKKIPFTSPYLWMESNYITAKGCRF